MDDQDLAVAEVAAADAAAEVDLRPDRGAWAAVAAALVAALCPKTQSSSSLQGLSTASRSELEAQAAQAVLAEPEIQAQRPQSLEHLETRAQPELLED